MAQGGHVLIIEDELLIALELEALLSELGFRSFAFAACPSEALVRATAQKPDLITADYKLLRGTGVEAVQLIEIALGRLPVVYVTGNAEVLRAEIAAIIVDKPVLPVALALACAQACQWRRLAD